MARCTHLCSRLTENRRVLPRGRVGSAEHTGVYRRGGRHRELRPVSCDKPVERHMKLNVCVCVCVCVCD